MIVSVFHVDSAFVIITFNMMITLIIPWILIKFVFSRFRIGRFLLGIMREKNKK